MQTSYKCVILTMHSKTSAHVPGYFEEELNRWASQGWKFMQAVRMDDIRFSLIFERMDG